MSRPARAPAVPGLLDDAKLRLLEHVRRKLEASGWKLAPALPAFARQRFSTLLPPPDAAFSVTRRGTVGELGVAVHVFDDTAYAYLMCDATGSWGRERGHLDPHSGRFLVSEVTGFLDDGN